MKRMSGSIGAVAFVVLFVAVALAAYIVFGLPPGRSVAAEASGAGDVLEAGQALVLDIKDSVPAGNQRLLPSPSPVVPETASPAETGAPPETAVDREAPAAQQEPPEPAETETSAPQETPALQPGDEGLPLSGLIFCIDAGHQRQGNHNHEPVAPGASQTKPKVSSGTRGVATGKYEYEVNLEVALQLRDVLESQGAAVYMVREIHDVDISNAERAQYANSVGADLAIRIHADGSENASARGFSVLVPGASGIGDEGLAKESADAGYAVEAGLLESTGAASRGVVTRNDLTGFNWLTVPSVLVEMGFMTNAEEDALLSDPAYQALLVEGIVNGLITYYSK